MQQVSEVVSNLPRVTQTWDEEWSAKQSYSNPPEFRPEVAPLALDEHVERLDDLNYVSAARRRWDEQSHFMGKDNEAMRLVNILSPESVFRKLRRAGVDARSEAPHFDVWMPEDETGRPICVRRERSIGRLWLHDEAVQGRVGISAWVIENGQRVRKMVTTLQYPYGPEWSLLHFDKYDVPICEKYRGWRTAMLQLILADVLTEQEVHRAFGNIPLGPVSLLYRRQLQAHRARRMGLVQ